MAQWKLQLQWETLLKEKMQLTTMDFHETGGIRSKDSGQCPKNGKVPDKQVGNRARINNVKLGKGGATGATSRVSIQLTTVAGGDIDSIAYGIQAAAAAKLIDEAYTKSLRAMISK